MKFLRNTSIMLVKDIESCLPFWEGSLGFNRIAEVPHEEKLGFVLLELDEVRIMLQSQASALADLEDPALAPLVEPGQVWQYVDLDSIDELLPRLPEEMVVVGERTTFYGAREGE